LDRVGGSSSILALALALNAAVPAASAHLLKELETALGDHEKYFQPVDKSAPDFMLQDADGRGLRLTDFV
jgi:protein SCO1